MSPPVRAPPATAVAAPSSAGLMARVGRGLMDAPRAVGGLPNTAKRMSLKLQAGMAEFLLISHLRARKQSTRSPDQSEDVLQRGAHIVDVTCKNWFPAMGTKRASSAYRTRI
jgi:hypothetical protein